MRPYIRSRKAQTDWGPGGDKVAYHYEKQSERIKNPSKSFVLSFSYTFQHDDDEVYVAAGIPYTYTFLQKQLISFKELAQGRPKLKFEVTAIGRSMCGLDIPLLTIEHQESLPSDKKFIIINTRTHSGEASSSWVLDGLLIELVSSQ